MGRGAVGCELHARVSRDARHPSPFLRGQTRSFLRSWRAGCSCRGLRLLRLQGQTVLEYAAVLAMIVAALLSMQLYVKRGISGRLRGATDSIGPPYAPKETTSSSTLNTSSDTTTTLELLKKQRIESKTVDVMRTTTTINQTGRPGDTVKRSGTETVGPLGTDLWSR